MYTIGFDPHAIDFLEKLPHEIKARIFHKILSTKENPYRFFERLEGRTDYKLRIGDYRVIAEIERNAKSISVTLIGHRKNIYKK